MRAIRGVLIGTALIAIVVMIGDIALRSFAPPLQDLLDPGNLHPASSVVCDTGITPRCAMEAADRRNATVAWVTEGTGGFRPGDLVVVPDRLAFQELRSGVMIATLHSDPPRSLVAYGSVIRSVLHSGIETEIHLTNEDGLEEARATWLLEGRRYALVVVSLSKGERVDITAVIELMRAIRYAPADTTNSR